MNGNISKPGITSDLEAIKAAGVGGVQVFNVGLDVPPGEVKFMSPEWRECVEYAVKECDRLGLEFSIHTCDGWSQSGGPWITPDMAMQKVTYAEVRVAAGERVKVKLPMPPVVQDYYRDICVVAFPTPAHDVVVPGEKLEEIRTDVKRLEEIEAKSPSGSIALPVPTAGAPRVVTWVFKELQTVRAVVVGYRSADGPAKAVLEASEDGGRFQAVGPLPTPGESFSMDHVTTWSFPAVRGRYFRVVVSEGGRLPNVVFRMSFVSGDRVDRVENKAGAAPRESTTAWSGRAAEPEDIIDPATVRDVSRFMQPDGTLTWDVPATGGEGGPRQWTVLRLGHTLTGRTNQAATKEGLGLECDKLSAEAVRRHFEAYAAKVLGDNKASIGRSFTFLHLDSWEALCQNWTPAMPGEFRSLRGYEMTSYYPVLTGRIVGSLQQSERFLFDLRRTVADLVNENHFALLTRLCHESGVKLEAEGTGPNMPTIAHGLEAKARVDLPMGEFWVGREVRADCKEAGSSGHIYGKQIVPAEAFTAVKGDFTDDFYSLKPLGDSAFAMGITRFVFHRFVHQPWPDRFPGMGMGPYGMNFDRTNTWWPEVRVWTDYIARSQYLLQQGRAAADVLYYTGENVPFMLPPRRELRPELPAGWDYDACSAEELMTLRVGGEAEGSGVRPVEFASGARYRVIVLPESAYVSPRVLGKIRELVEQGAAVVGPRPTWSPSLAEYPACDEQVRHIAAQLWADIDGKAVTSHMYGKGRVYSGTPLAEVLGAIGTRRDVEILEMNPAADRAGADGTAAVALHMLHRRTEAQDIYFLANPRLESVIATLRFRDSAGAPEIWNAETGAIAPAPVMMPEPGSVGTALKVRFGPAGSRFVIFRRDSARPRLAIEGPDAEAALEWTGEGLELTASVAGTYQLSVLPRGGLGEVRKMEVTVPGVSVTPPPLPGVWKVRFVPPSPVLGEAFEMEFDGLTPWQTHADARVRGFSGTATYTAKLNMGSRVDGGQPLVLDLGEVKNIAVVSVNGKRVGVLWKPPFRVDIAPALRAGDNELAIAVTNLWPNRMIADAALPAEARKSFTTTKHWSADGKPLPSGLLGPVRLLPATRVRVELGVPVTR
jgi:hypothetical protein